MPEALYVQLSRAGASLDGEGSSSHLLKLLVQRNGETYTPQHARAWLEDTALNCNDQGDLLPIAGETRWISKTSRARMS